MKLLLLNENPVVTKLVTLSAQKTGDELVSASSVEEVEAGNYDLLIVDDGSFDETVMEQLQEKVTSSKTLFMGARGSELPSGFEAMLSKPFLPTDLVELFSTAAKELPEESAPEQEPEDTGVFTVEDDFSDDMELADLDALDDIELGGMDEELTLDDEGSGAVDMEESLDLDGLLDDDSAGEELLDDLDAGDEPLELDDLSEGLDLGDIEDELLMDEADEGVLDKDELEEVQSLLDETEAESSDAFEIDDLDEIAGLNSSTLEEVNSALDEMDDLLESDEAEEDSAEMDLSSFDEEENLDDALAELDALSGDALEAEESDEGASPEEAALEEMPLSEENEEMSDAELDALLGEEDELSAEETEAVADESAEEAPTENAQLDEIKAAIAGLSSSSEEAEEAAGEADLDVMEEEEPLDMDVLLEEAASDAEDESDIEELLDAEEETAGEADLDVMEGDEPLDMDALLEEVASDAAVESDVEELLGGEEEQLELSDDDFDLEELQEMAAEEEVSSDESEEEALDVDALLEEGLEDELEEVSLDDEEMADDMAMPELPDDLDSIEDEIENAVAGLSEEELEQPVDEEMLLDIVGAEDEVSEAVESGGGFDELDTLSEQALKVALGEAEEERATDEVEFRVGDSAFASLGAEALDEAMADTEVASDLESLDTMLDESTEQSAPTQEGVEALQALLKALSNEEVAKSLKGMNININISFGDKD